MFFICCWFQPHLFSEPPELVWILREWTEIHAQLFGGFKIKLSILGLAKIFTSNNQNLEKLNISVKGDLIATTGRATRSGSSFKAEYAQEPLKLRIFKMLIQEHDVRTHQKAPRTNTNLRANTKPQTPTQNVNSRRHTT